MARPRPVFPGKIYLVTRRCTRRQFLLRPGKRTNQAVLYCIAEAANRCGIQVLWLFAMSGHLHYGLYDPNENYPRFIAHFHKMLAKVLNCHLGRWGSLFEDEQTSMVELADADAVFDKMIYSLANAVLDHLVKYARDWPGATSLPYQLSGQPLVVRRPDWFFRTGDDATMPEVVTLRFERPPNFRHLPHANWANMIRTAIRVYERRALQERREDDTRVLGRGKVLAQSAFDFPKTDAPQRNISPSVAAKDPRIRIATLARNKAWRIAYATALETYRAGDADVAFPAGTWQLYQDGHVFRHAA